MFIWSRSCRLFPDHHVLSLSYSTSSRALKPKKKSKRDSKQEHLKGILEKISKTRHNPSLGPPKQRSPLEPLKQKPPPESPKQKPLLSQKVGEWKRESWKSDWGEDKLRPAIEPLERKKKGKPLPKSNQSYPIAYTRRIEGLIEPLGKPVLTDIPPVHEQLPVANLAHGLDRVLFNPGVHWLQDPRSRVYNFTPWLENIPKVTDFAFERLSGFVKSSRDEELWTLLKRENRTFAGSTSSLTGMLSHIYFLISGDKDVDTQTLSRGFWKEPTTFTPGQRMPCSVLFNHRDGTYAIDSNSDKAGHAEKNILTWMGTLLEKFLTMTSKDFMSYLRSAPAVEQISDSTKDAFRYAKSDRFVMRSQLDCQDKRLPGTGVFDIKTRACLPIRLDILNFEEHSGYLIRTQHGIIESFEKEYYDLIRSAFLKYSFQVRIGNMDGVLVAYHNTARMFGFQYIPLEEMDACLFGPGRGIGDKVFERCVRLLEIICQEIGQCFPGESVRCTLETKENDGKLNVWVEPAEWNGSGERPVQQLEVQVSNYIGISAIPGSLAISACDNEDDVKWRVHWRICRLSDNEDDIRSALQAAKDRLFRAYNFPTGVDASEMPEFWAGLNFSGSKPESEVAYRMENFRSASPSIQKLREVSRAGKEETELMVAQEAGKPKIVYGEKEPWSDMRPALPCTTYNWSDEASLMEREEEQEEQEDLLVD